jgi:hypothetical protein
MSSGMILRPALASALLAALIAWAPLPFGSVTSGFAALLQVATFLLAAAAPWLALDDTASRRGAARPAAWAAAAIAAVALLGLLQSAALPAALVATLSPERFRLGLESAAVAGAPPPTAMTLSLAPDASRAAALDWLLAAAALWVGARLGALRRTRRVLAVAILGSAVFQVLFGARQWLVGSSAIWGVETPLQALRLRGTFVNPNHLALYLEMALAVAVAAGWWCARRAAGEASAERRLLLLGVPLLTGLTLAAGLAFTGSRSGLLAGAAACALEVGLLARGRRRAWVLAGGAAAAAAAVALVAWTGFEAGFGRLLATSAPDASGGARLAASARTFELFTRFPVCGVGLGAFLAAFPLVQGSGLEGTWRHAHDDWMELAATTGLAGTLLFAAALAVGLAGLLRAGRRAARSEDRASVVAAAGALAAVALHSLTDFGLTLPANALTLAVVAGAALAVGDANEERPRRAAGQGDLPEVQPPEETAVQPAEEPVSKPLANTGCSPGRACAAAAGVPEAGRCPVFGGASSTTARRAAAAATAQPSRRRTSGRRKGSTLPPVPGSASASSAERRAVRSATVAASDGSRASRSSRRKRLPSSAVPST